MVRMVPEDHDAIAESRATAKPEFAVRCVAAAHDENTNSMPVAFAIKLGSQGTNASPPTPPHSASPPHHPRARATPGCHRKSRRKIPLAPK